MALKWRMVWMAGPGVTSFGPSVGPAESGQTVELSEGQVLTVELPRRLASSDWRVAPSSLGAGVLEMQRQHPDASDLTATTRVFEFRAVAAGDVTLALAPLLQLVGAETDRAFELTVQVR